MEDSYELQHLRAHIHIMSKHSGLHPAAALHRMPANDGASHSHTWLKAHMPELASPQVGHAEVAHNAPLRVHQGC